MIYDILGAWVMMALMIGIAYLILIFVKPRK